MKAKEVMNILNITRSTLSRYVKQGYIKVSKTPTNVYIYDDESVYAFIGLKKEKTNTKIISYSRVSTQSQKDQLKEQTQRIYDSCISKGIKLDEQFEDIKSGMDYNRKGFQNLIQQVIEGKVKMIVVENKDRLVRFGFDILENIFKYFGTTILVLNDSISNKTYEQELTEDLISIIHYFTMKSYSHRRKLNKIRKELEESKNEIETDNEEKDKEVEKE